MPLCSPMGPCGCSGTCIATSSNRLEAWVAGERRVEDRNFPDDALALQCYESRIIEVQRAARLPDDPENVRVEDFKLFLDELVFIFARTTHPPYRELTANLERFVCVLQCGGRCGLPHVAMVQTTDFLQFNYLSQFGSLNGS